MKLFLWCAHGTLCENWFFFFCMEHVVGSVSNNYFQLFPADPTMGLTLAGAALAAGVSGTSAGSVRMLISITLSPRSMGSVRRRPRLVQTCSFCSTTNLA